MKIDRLIGILSILLQNEKVTAPYLAEKFEVSRRTINRDVEDICKAGIPLVTTQGTNGGISIAEGYKIDKTLLTSHELQSILTGLKGLDSISGTKKYSRLIDKLSVKNRSVYSSTDHILVNLASYYKGSLAPKIEMIQTAIDESRLISFQYYANSGESKRVLEPYLIVFQWTSWYVWGYCRQKEDMRLFKLNRLWNLTVEDNVFLPRTLPEYDGDIENVFPDHYQVHALFHPSAKWRLIEEYGIDCYTVADDGRLSFRFGFASKENLVSWILSFGNLAKVIEPVPIRDEIYSIVKKMYTAYSET
ncbi:helix-turn-helix transcriptional regulator [uncultured Robinsoniella sp.]|uniref:helix-turn-helix transcriptional regulator n=2 Tax=Robinsoniella TaxID=588605 RepID=UPI00374EE5DD